MIYLLLIVLGLILGSFINALVWRVHEQSIGKHKAKNINLSVINGRSMCVHCKHELAAKDLIPVLSWVSLSGKCRYCKKAISWQYPLVETIMAIFLVLSYAYWPYEFSTASWLVFGLWSLMLVGLIGLAIYDLRWMLLPNRILYPLFLLAVTITLISWLYLDTDINIVNIGSSVVIAGGIFYLLFIFSGGKWIGGGDVKYGFLAGILLASPIYSFLTLMFASILGTVVIIFGLSTKKLTRKSKIPFGPFLILATILMFVFGSRIFSWYEVNVLLINT